MKSFLTNWKTTLAGIVVIGLYGLQMVGVNIPGVHIDPATLAVGAGLIFAKDGNVTGGTTKQ